MKPAVLHAWHRFSTPLEGRVLSMYVDVKNLVTTGVGNLIDPVGAALRLPWKHEDGRPATAEEIRAQWLAIKHHPGLAVKPGGPLVPLPKLHWKYAAKLTTLRLTDADVDALVVAKLLDNERQMRKAYPNWDDFPADAQLGCLSMSWAVGPGFPAIFKNFSRCAVQQDWVGAKAGCKIKTDGNPGVVPRNRNNELCFDNAATVIQYALDRTVLHWPEHATIPEPGADKPSSQPELDETDRARAAAFADEYARQVVNSIHHSAMREMAGLDDARKEMTDGED